MAEINIERKKTPVWRWLLILILLALIAWAVYEFAYDKEDNDFDEVPATGMVTLVPQAPLLT
ncbi:hypothetical protein [Adhaeribacter rhizoryzae]|uniref:Uncharacterized protein n=1 Tax=Adhaeribacter rhizoryzae TaxID=2607907 RepID=A0A5M6D3B5_9BACT|nr:hypothetical protein [Adhaeribacter rhizoryzae]KAA5540792.1 hypothetical protein F0145_22040 [Adhaeribacter rhizoryzae]